MITVNRVYVDAEGVVRMSPTGWPEEPKNVCLQCSGKGYITGIEWPCSCNPGGEWRSSKTAHQRYNAALQKAKEESIPFEDRQAMLNLINSYHEAPAGYSPKKGNFYTIEPIQVELRYFFTIEITVEGIPNMKGITQTEYQRLKETLSESQFKRDVKVVARIVTEEEKPAPPDYKDLLTSPKSWTEDYSHENGKYLCSCCYCKSQFMGHKRRVVCKECADKPRCECELFVEKYYGLKPCPHIDGTINTDYADLVNLLAMFRDELKQPAPEASAAFPQFQKCSFLQETHTTATDHTVCQPAPVVDKPDQGNIIDFLLGSGSFDGLWWGLPPTDDRPKFWWRSALREYIARLRQQPTERIQVQQSQFSNSAVGSHHWAAALLSYIMRVGEYMNEHGVEKQNDMQQRGWGLGIKERAAEINNYLQSLPEPHKP